MPPESKKADTSLEESGSSLHGSREAGSVEVAPGCLSRLYPAGFLPELKEIIKLAGPMILTQLTIYFLGPVALIFCGHLGKAELDGVALANSLLNVTGISIAVGLSSACDTLFSQVFGSANKHKLGIVLQRSILIIGLASLLSIAIHLNAEPLCLLLGQDPEVSRLVGEYLLILIPGTFSFFIYISVSKYLQNQNIIVPPLIVGGIVNALNALLHYLFLYVGNMRTEGSALAQSICYFLMMFLMVAYVYFSGVYKSTWSGLDLECLQSWGQFFLLGVFGLLMICIEWWSFEVGIILAGVLGTTELGAQSTVFQIEMVAYMIPLGTGVSASIRVGQFLGAGNSVSACTSARVAITFVCLTGIIMSVLIITLKDYLPLIFTNVPEVVEMASTIFPILGFYMLFDSVAGTCAGILRGCGLQKEGAAIVFCGYVLALSTGIPLMFLTSIRLQGFWGGLAGALLFESLVFSVLIYRMSWPRQAELAQDRAKVKEQSSEDIEHNSDVDEKTALLASRSTGTRSVTEEEQALPLRQLIPRRVAAIGIMVAVLALGIVLRFTMEVNNGAEATEPLLRDIPGNVTKSFNPFTSSSAF